MKRFIAAISFALLAGAAFAADPQSGRTPLPDLAGSTGAGKTVGELRPRRLPSDRASRLDQRQLERRQYLGPRSYWENDPLFIAPPP